MRIFLEVFSFFFFQRLRLDLELKKQTRGIPDIGGAPNIDYTVGFLDLTTKVDLWSFEH